MLLLCIPFYKKLVHKGLTFYQMGINVMHTYFPHFIYRGIRHLANAFCVCIFLNFTLLFLQRGIFYDINRIYWYGRNG